MGDQGHQWRADTGRAGPADGGPCPVDRLQCLILAEVDTFADLRRRLGVARAELVMLDVAERIAALLPDATVATVGRNLIELGTVVADQAALDGAVRAIHLGFDQPLVVDGESYRLALTLGVAAADGPHLDDVGLVEEAERALANARPQAPAAASSAVAGPVPADDLALGRELGLAATRDELFLQYQPKLHLRRQQIVSIEALIRWQHPRNGLVLPSNFIPAAERSGDIAAVTLWTLRQVIADQRVLRRNGYDLPIFINIAGQLLSDSAFIEASAVLVQESGAKVGFEITETSVIRDPDSAIQHLQRLADIGIVITIDDYGAGLSSLAYLKQLPASELKIDKLFVTQLTSSHRDPLIVRSTIDLAHALEMEVVAEGVETATSLALLSVMGCDMVQGFLISRPLALEALLAYLRDDRHLAIVRTSHAPLERLAAVRARG